MPIYGDQALAAVHVQQVGTGILIEILELTEATFGDAVNKVLHDQKLVNTLLLCCNFLFNWL